MNKKRNVNYFSCENSVMVKKSIYHASFQSVKIKIVKNVLLKIAFQFIKKIHQKFFFENDTFESVKIERGNVDRLHHIGTFSLSGP